jgi:hypothetical protein
MAYLALVASHTVNGVAAIHSDLIKTTIFKVGTMTQPFPPIALLAVLEDASEHYGLRGLALEISCFNTCVRKEMGSVCKALSPNQQ